MKKLQNKQITNKIQKTSLPLKEPRNPYIDVGYYYKFLSYDCVF